MRIHRPTPAVAAGVVLAAIFLVGCGPTRQPGAAPVSLTQPVRRADWTFAGRKGQVLGTQHYQLFTTVDTPTLRNSMPGFLEACRGNYARLTGLASTDPADTPMSVYLFSTRREWAMLTEKVTGPQAGTYLSIETGGYCYAGKCVFWNIGMLATHTIAAHEGMHQFLYQRNVSPLPPWAEEGLAVLAEGFKISNGTVRFRPDQNVFRFTNLRRAILSGRWRPAGKLLAMGAGENARESVWAGAEYYGQLWAMLLLIRSDPEYSRGLRRLIADTSSGELAAALNIPPQVWTRLKRNARQYIGFVGPRAFTHYIEADMDRFERRYLAFAKELVHVR